MTTDLPAAAAVWLNPRKKRFWILVLIVLYSILGFFGVPWLIKKELPEFSQSLLGRDAAVGEVRFNPWLLKLDASELELLDANSAPLVQIDRLVANLQVSSLFYRALTFSEIGLTDPAVFISRYESGDSNIGNLVAELTAEPAPVATEKSEEGSLLRLIIGQLKLNNGRINISDATVANSFTTALAPIDIDVSNLSTLADRAGNQVVSIFLEGGSRLDLSGSLQLNPLLISGNLNLAGSPIPVVQRYLDELLEFNVAGKRLNAQLDFAVADHAEAGLSVKIENFGAVLGDVVASTEDTGQEIFSLPEIAIRGGTLNWPEQTIRISELAAGSPAVNIWLNPDGSLNMAGLLADTGVEPERTDTVPATEAPDSNDPWMFTLENVAVNSLRARFDDYSLTEPAGLEITSLDLGIQHVTTSPNEPARISIDATSARGGQIKLAGDLVLLPALNLTAQADVQNLALAAAQPWAANFANITINDGVVSTQGTLSSNTEETLEYRGDIQLANLDVSDTVANEILAGLGRLDLKQMRFGLDTKELEISRVVFDRPFARVAIDREGVTNFQKLSKDGTSENQESPARNVETGSTPPFILKVGKTSVKDGSVDFSDMSLPLPFRVLITEFGGTVSALASNSGQESVLDFDGKVGDYGLATVDGTLNVMAPTDQADVALVFRNVNMPDLSPYTMQFAGQKIEAGKLDLELNYTFKDRKMNGSNELVLESLVLGDKVEVEGAADLPLQLAVALLKNVDGVIDLDLTVSGDLDDPDFSIGGIILRTFVNLITKAVTAPFKLLGALVPGGGEDDFSNLLFEAGDAKLTPPELEKLDQLATALAQRPKLSLQVPGAYHARNDTPALQQRMVEALLAAEMGEDDPKESAETLTRRARRVLEKLSRRELADVDLGEIRARNQLIDPETGKQSLDEFAYLVELRELLAAIQQVPDTELIALGEARQRVVIDYLQRNESTESNRVVPTSVAESNINDEGWIIVELGLEVASGSVPVAVTDPERSTTPAEAADE